MASIFKLHTNFSPRGDQPKVIDRLTRWIKSGNRFQTLLGVTGSGKTFTMANVIKNLNRPALIIAPNKTLAAQLFSEFKAFFPENAVEYFVSYYDYYQPEAYIPATDTYIEKDSSINDFIDRLRHSATYSLLTRRDVIIVASVSCIYGLGSPEEYQEMHLFLKKGLEISRERILAHLVTMLYERAEVDFKRGTFRVRGDILEVFPSYEEERAIRIELFGDEVERISLFDPLTGRRQREITQVVIYPSSHYVTSQGRLELAIKTIRAELKERLRVLEREGKLVEKQRLEQRTNLDLEMLEELGYCHGIENYSRHLTGRAPGESPPTLLDYFPDDFITFIDESHITVPQLRGMYAGDRSRKETLVEFGFRLPSALDNRPLRFDEFLDSVGQVVFVSATPGPFELEVSKDKVCEQIRRPTGLMDPRMEVRPATNQVDDLLNEIRKVVSRGERVLITTLTKRMAEELTEYYRAAGVRVEYLHSDIKTVDRSKIIKGLRSGEFDVLIGINLLREGLDMPEVSLVAVLDADKEGFLRSERSLIQTAGRAARNANGLVILYADTITGSMERAISETKRRRRLQGEYNEKHGIVPKSVSKTLEDALTKIYEEDRHELPRVAEEGPSYGLSELSISQMEKRIKELEKEMYALSKELRFEEAAKRRDEIKALKERLVSEA